MIHISDRAELLFLQNIYIFCQTHVIPSVISLFSLNTIFSRSHFSLSTVPPDILDYDTSTDMVVMEGRNVTLRCAATGSPAPNITWRREDGQQIQLGNGEEGEF